MTHPYTPAQLEAWAGLGPWEIKCGAYFPYDGRIEDVCGIFGDVHKHDFEQDPTITPEPSAALIVAAPDLARLVLEKDAEIARLKAAIQDIAENWEWWNEDRHDRCSSVVGDSIAEAEQAMKGDEKP